MRRAQVLSRWFDKKIRTATAVLLAGLASGCAPTQEGPPRRIILMVVDTLRRDFVSAYGSSAATPNIDRLAARGQIFTNATASFHQTTMSMAALFTGRTPSLENSVRGPTLPWNSQTYCGMARFAEEGDEDCVPSNLPTLAEDLRDAGYWTAGIVANPLLFRPYGFDRGFDQWFEIRSDKRPVGFFEAAESRTAEFVNRPARDVIAQRSSVSLFLYLHYLDIHDYSLLTRSRGRTAYRKAVERFDRELGQFLDFLESDGLHEDSIVILVSDHGEALREKHALRGTLYHKGNPSFEPVLRIPLIVSPAQFDDPSIFVRSQDVGNLIRQIAGIPARENDDLAPGELLITEKRFRTYRRGRWKSVWNRTSGDHYLFDLLEDPGESRDISALHPAVVADHRKRVAWLATSLSTRSRENSVLTREDADRLRALGYLD